MVRYSKRFDELTMRQIMAMVEFPWISAEEAELLFRAPPGLSREKTRAFMFADIMARRASEDERRSRKRRR